MPTRILRDGIISSRAVAGLSDQAEILYRRLMSVVDDYGRMEADIDLIRAKCFPVQLERWTTARVFKAFAELGSSPLVTIYSGPEKKLFQLNKFGQRVQSKPKYPSPEECVENKGLPFSTVDHGEPRWISVQSESESETESNNPLCAESAKPAPSAGKIHQLPDPDIEAVAERIYERHPPQRRCGGSEIRKKLHAIIKRHSRLGKERALATVDKNHAAQCKSEQWSKSGGEFAKGLGNWLAPTEDRYLVEPDAKSRDSPQSLGAAYMPYVDPLRGMV
jgi:hypothetical protein